MRTARSNVEEAERLLSSVDEPPTEGAPASSSQGRPKYLRVVVEPKPGATEDGGSDRVNVRVPMALLRAGMRLASIVPQMARGPIDEALKKKGVDFDLSSVKAEDFEAVVDALRDLEVDVEDSTRTVRVYIE